MLVRLLIALALVIHPLTTAARAGENSVPATVDGGAAKIKEGGKDIGEGFKGVGRGIKKMFTGERSKEEFKKAGKIGEGFKDVGLGTAGVGRGVGRGIRKGFRGDSKPGEQHRDGALQEETLPE
jgi:hypothetical protein